MGAFRAGASICVSIVRLIGMRAHAQWLFDVDDIVLLIKCETRCAFAYSVFVAAFGFGFGANAVPMIIMNAKAQCAQ